MNYKTESFGKLIELVAQVKAQKVTKDGEVRNLSPDERLREYIKYFVTSGIYDYAYLDEVKEKKGAIKSTRQDNERALHRFLYEGKGVCQQFAQALSLACGIDGEIECRYTEALVMPKGANYDVVNGTDVIERENDDSIGHGFNVVRQENGERSIVDISSMIHCEDGKKGRRGGYASDKQNFAFVSLEEYKQNLATEGPRLVLRKFDEKGTYYYLYAWRHFDKPEELEKYYNMLNFSDEEKIQRSDMLEDPKLGPKNMKTVPNGVEGDPGKIDC